MEVHLQTNLLVQFIQCRKTRRVGKVSVDRILINELSTMTGTHIEFLEM